MASWSEEAGASTIFQRARDESERTRYSVAGMTSGSANSKASAPVAVSSPCTALVAPKRCETRREDSRQPGEASGDSPPSRRALVPRIHRMASRRCGSSAPQGDTASDERVNSSAVGAPRRANRRESDIAAAGNAASAEQRRRPGGRRRVAVGKHNFKNSYTPPPTAFTLQLR